MWGDEKFCRLTAPPPCGQSLWIYLLGGPETSNVPGLYRAGEAALAESLRWPLEGFRKAFAEVSREGMAEADWNARVVWLPKAITHNQPESPNVVRGWRRSWEEIPECALKAKAHQVLKVFVEDIGEGFAKAFAETCPKPLANQEQEQKPKQEQNQESAADAADRASASAKAAETREITVWFDSIFVPAYPEALRATQQTSARNYVVRTLRPNEGARAKIMEHLEAWKRTDKWARGYGYGLKKFFENRCHEQLPLNGGTHGRTAEDRRAGADGYGAERARAAGILERRGLADREVPEGDVPEVQPAAGGVRV